MASSLLGACSMNISHDSPMVDLLYCNDWGREERLPQCLGEGQGHGGRASIGTTHHILKLLPEWQIDKVYQDLHKKVSEGSRKYWHTPS
jgi:hypothetical protein